MIVWRMTWELIRFQPKLYLRSLTIWFIVFGVPLLTGWLLQLLFNALTGSATVGLGVNGLIVLLILSFVVRIVALLFGFYADYTFNFYAKTLVQKNALEAILQRPGAQALRHSIGEAINRFRDDAGVLIGFISWTVDLCYKPLYVLVALVVMATINWKLTLVVVLPLALVLFASNAAKGYIEKQRKISRDATGRVSGFLGEAFDAVQAIQVANAEERVTAHFQRLSDRRRQSMVRDRMVTDVLDMLFQNAVTLITGLLLLFGASAVVQKTFTIGDFTLFLFYLDLMTQNLQFLGRMMANYRQSGISVERLRELTQLQEPLPLVAHGPVYLDGKEPLLTTAEKTERDRLRLLEAEGLTFRYKDSGRGVEDVDLRLERGTLTVITGRIGAGKTTLLRALLGLLPLERGAVYWNGERIADLGGFLHPPRTSYAAQVPQLFSESVRDNILLGRTERDADLAQALEAAVLTEDVAGFAQGLDTVVGTRGMKVSGGQAQRIAAARMFVQDAELLVLDDISSALDVKTTQLLWERLLRERDKTYLVVSHNPSVLQRADRIVLLKEGRVEAEGTLAELLERSEEMRSLWREEEQQVE